MRTLWNVFLWFKRFRGATTKQEAHVGRGVGCGLGSREASGDDVDSQGRRGKEKGEEEEEGSAGYSAAATSSASLLPVAGRGGGSGKRTA